MLIEADAFKETDVIYRALNSRGHHDDMLQTAESVHSLFLNSRRPKQRKLKDTIKKIEKTKAKSVIVN